MSERCRRMADRLVEYADTLERANVHEDMGLSLCHTQTAEVMREAAGLLASLPPSVGRPQQEEEKDQGDGLPVSHSATSENEPPELDR